MFFNYFITGKFCKLKKISTQNKRLVSKLLEGEGIDRQSTYFFFLLHYLFLLELGTVQMIRSNGKNKLYEGYSTFLSVLKIAILIIMFHKTSNWSFKHLQFSLSERNF